MPSTLFVVDDSATMRKVFEMTFAGEDITVVTHDGSDGVVTKVRDARPQAAIIDVALASGTGYDVVRALRGDAAIGNIPIYLLYSEHSQLDEAAARSCGAMGAIVKPFETQVLIDKVRQALAAGSKPSVTATTGNVTAPFGHSQAAPTPIGAIPPAPTKGAEVAATFSAPRPGGGILNAPQRAATAASTPARPPASPKETNPVGAAVRPPPPLPGQAARAAAAAPAASASASASAAAGLQSGASTAVFHAEPRRGPVERVPEKPVEKPASPARAAIVEDEVRFEAPAEPARVVDADKPAATDAVVAAAARAVEQRVQSLGLSPAQVDAVTALTRDVVERVVWEVVPQLAEVMIREEIKRLTAP